jgi:hypothetical protein
MNLKPLKTAITLFTNFKIGTAEEDNAGYSLAFLPVFGALVAVLWVLFYNYVGVITTPITKTCGLVAIPLLTVSRLNISGFKKSFGLMLKTDNNFVLSTIAFVYYMLLFAAYLFLDDMPKILLTAGGFVFGRSIAGIMLVTANGAKDNTMPHTTKQKFVSGSVAVVGIVGAMALMEGANPIMGIIALFISLIFAFVISKVYDKKLGGCRLELIGLYISVTELIIAAVAAMDFIKL